MSFSIEAQQACFDLILEKGHHGVAWPKKNWFLFYYMSRRQINLT